MAQEKKQRVKVAIVGFGTVGEGVARLILGNGESIYERTGVSLELAHVVDTDLDRRRGVRLPEGVLHSDLDEALSDKEVSIVVELVGGTGIAAEIQQKALKAGKDVVTANKALLAERGEEVIFSTARKAGRCVAFEASCCGGIPIVGAIQTGLAANQIHAMYGIFNGTCNYILTEMTASGKSYDQALREAQEAGYAEADPTLDVNGSDTAHKLAILAMLAFGQEVGYEQIPVEGIDQLELEDICYGQELGYAMKLLAVAERSGDRLSLRVHPSFIHQQEPLAQVAGPFNAISIFGDAVGHTSYYGRGAGMMPTASAVTADIIRVAQGNAGRIFSATPGLGKQAAKANLCPAQEIRSRFYLRLCVLDRPGVFAQIARILGDRQISISACLQRESHSPESVPVIIMTHQVRKGGLEQALADISAQDFIRSKPVCIHVVTPPENDLSFCQE